MDCYLALFFVAIFSIASAAPKLDLLSARIVGGEDAPDGAFPYMVPLRKDKNEHHCGGSIIGDRWILTAGHCLGRNNFSHVLAGSNLLDQGGDKYYVEKQIIHPKYNLIINDIGLILLSNPIQFNKRVQLNELATLDIDKNDYPAITMGWGFLEVGGPVSNKLQLLRTRLMNNEFCFKEPHQMTSLPHCTFNRSGKGICKGDSGSPLMVDGKQVGITSYTYGDCASGSPDFYTRVVDFLDWINEEMTKLKSIS